MRKITIDPITRLEGHGKIEIFLDESGDVKEAYLQVPELRGFEKFCEGRKAEDMPQLTSRICGVCPVAHHFASTKALDMAFGVEPTDTAKKLRELIYCGYIIYDHILHFYFLGGPDFIVGPDAPKEKRNIIGVIEKVGSELASEVIKHRAYGQKITEILGGKPTHPVCGIPGGVTKSLTTSERDAISEMAQSCYEFALKTLDLFHKFVLEDPRYLSLIMDPVHTLKVYNMGLVDEKNRVNFYDGMVRVTDPQGQEFLKFHPKDYLSYIAEEVLEWSYVKLPYLKQIGFKGLKDGADSGLYRVGPLARLNAADGMATPKAQEEYELMYKTFQAKPVHNTLAYHWARLIELLYATERLIELVNLPEITNTDIRNMDYQFQQTGIGVVEAARGTLIHHYELTEDFLIKKVNLIVATTNNTGVLNLSIKNAAKDILKNKSPINENLLNTIEMFYRAYDPCMACASHTINSLKLVVNIYNSKNELLTSLSR
ncbi:MAG: Ni/Fe hydrogenase subunit alpha [candidate division WOR-3 bacterium]|nr:Ni/Fe hydrogenase subunit alpha [candidate division WOR-3 bacterium]MCX7757834.1 Ni/Fe hydrogenase subunit alpha [candidate division WOR-3 bacterium]MDW7988079.1 Ni/Fe hydrogenase subunit alpha [candidate division WOR-3 bacterium]